MTGILDKINGYIAGLTADQLIALLLLVLVVSSAKSIIQHGLSLVFTVVGVLAALYFVAPELYYMAFELLEKAYHAAIGMILDSI